MYISSYFQTSFLSYFVLQVELLRLRLSPTYPKVEIKSVDGFQGREKEAVLISFVRSNPKGEVGFLSERRRINVAITRARRHLMVVCDSETVGHDPFLKSLVDYMCSQGEVLTAHQYVEDGIVNTKMIRPEHLNDLLSIKTKGGSGQGAKPKQKQRSKQNDKPKDQQNKEQVKEKPKHITERDEEVLQKKTEEYQGYLDKFVADSTQDLLEFPSSLNSYDRLLIHELSEQMGLIHVSKGLDKNRHLVVSKPGVKVKDEVKVNKEVESCLSEDTSTKSKEVISEPKADSDKLTCKHCSKDVIKANFSLHELHCARKQKEASQKADSSKNSKNSSKNKTDSSNRPQSSKKGANKNAHKDVAAKLDKVDPDDFDALIATTVEYDSKCVYHKCKAKTRTLGHTCKYCMRRFCLNHSMPEVHGCGDEVKAQARASIIKEGILYQGSGVPSKLPDPTRKAILERKIEKKLTEMEAERQKKKKKK